MSFDYFLLLIYIFYLYFLPTASQTKSEDCYTGKIRTAGTGTVLFSPTDIYKTCWSQEEIAILTARLILEDVIPDPKMVSIQCNEDVDELVEYFKAVIDTIRSNTKARKRHIMLMALTDLFGGYLHHAILPMARKAYYAGAVDYSFMEKLIQLYEELKWFLRTNGQGWTKPLLHTKEVVVPPIDLNKNDMKKPNDTCCHKLLFFEHEPLKSRKRSVSTEKGIYFPLPFFDAKFRPTSIVVPLKRFALRNIESKRSAYIIMKYFISAEKCLIEKNAKPDMVEKFQNNLLTWIEKDVISKLDDDKFYSAFGGVLRVQTTLKRLGAKTGPATCNTDEGEEEVGAVPAVGCTSRRNKILLITMLIIIVAWFIIGTCFICYRMNRSSRNTKADQLEDTSKQGSSTSFGSSSRWSSFLSKSSSRSSKSHKQLCKCCESSISEKTQGFTSTSEYDSEKTRKRDKRKKISGSSKKKVSQSSPCICPSDGPAVIDTKHSVKVLPSIAEMSENSLSKGKQDSFRKISFADESGISSSDGGRPCAPPHAQTKNTVPCPILSNNFVIRAKTDMVGGNTVRYAEHDSHADATNYEPRPVAYSTPYPSRYEPSIQQNSSSNQTSFNASKKSDPSSTSHESNSWTKQQHTNTSKRLNFSEDPRKSKYETDTTLAIGADATKYEPSPVAYSTRYEPSVQQKSSSNQTSFNASKTGDPSSTSHESNSWTKQQHQANNTSRRHGPSEEPQHTRYDTAIDDFEPPMANSTFMEDATEYVTSNTPGDETHQVDSNKSISKYVSTRSVEEYPEGYSDRESQIPDNSKESQDKTYYDYHMTSACHSSMSGNYDVFLKKNPNKPNIFGYDFQTSTSSDLSDDDD